MMPEKLDFSSIVAIEAMFENFLQTSGLLHKGIGEVKLMSCLLIYKYQNFFYILQIIQNKWFLNQFKTPVDLLIFNWSLADCEPIETNLKFCRELPSFISGPRNLIQPIWSFGWGLMAIFQGKSRTSSSYISPTDDIS
jgi:hypothetical protein